MHVAEHVGKWGRHCVDHNSDVVYHIQAGDAYVIYFHRRNSASFPCRGQHQAVFPIHSRQQASRRQAQQFRCKDLPIRHNVKVEIREVQKSITGQKVGVLQGEDSH
ncbi:unnamed protein product [Cuscuta epithymum]|uniref:Uncharacterized protein n=1 Tax=Cuscuta epithymum TaxID=186058 RepID=A0AAV0E933_9ASTE|nr:unnamed protein product [Cuscuta epithymum]